jgi:dUTP pyrophosphatase
MTMAKVKPAVFEVRVKVLEHGQGLPLPENQSAGAAGLDLLAAVPDDEPMTLAPGARALVPTGLVIELPPGTEAQVRPRSGLAVKHGITVLNSPGTIDSDYRGEVKVLLVNLGETAFTIRRGERIAQMVVAAHQQVRLVTAKALSGTARGSGGFGSTGKAPPPGASAATVPRQRNKKAVPDKSPKRARGKAGRPT